MKAFCKKSYYNFKQGESYEVVQIISVFEPDDYITIRSKEEISFIDQSNGHKFKISDYRFKLKYSTQYVEDYIGENEMYFHDYFVNLNEERKNKLNQLSVTKV